MWFLYLYALNQRHGASIRAKMAFQDGCSKWWSDHSPHLHPWKLTYLTWNLNVQCRFGFRWLFLFQGAHFKVPAVSFQRVFFSYEVRPIWSGYNPIVGSLGLTLQGRSWWGHFSAGENGMTWVFHIDFWVTPTPTLDPWIRMSWSRLDIDRIHGTGILI